MTLKEQVKTTLEEQPDTRNSDIALTIEIWKRYYSKLVPINRNNIPFIRLQDLYELPNQDNIKRVRAQYNAKGRYWPTDWKIARGRGINEDKWRVELGYPPKAETKNPTRESSYFDKIVCECGVHMEYTLSHNLYKCFNTCFLYHSGCVSLNLITAFKAITLARSG